MTNYVDDKRCSSVPDQKCMHTTRQECFDKHLGTHPREITVTECKIEYNCPEPKPKPGYGNNSDHEMDSLVDEIY